MAKVYHELITDHSLVLEHAALLLEHGYYVTPAGAVNPGSNNDGKGWLVGRDRVKVYEPTADGSPPSVEQVMATFRELPGCGLSIAAPYTRDGRNDLLILDVDVVDPATLQAVAIIIGTPCPVKVGSKGASFFVRYPAMRSLPDLLEERNLRPVPKWAKPTYLGIPRLNKPEAIDFLGLKRSHSLIPPTNHYYATNVLNQPTDYHYIPFPGTEITLELHNTPLHDLPEFQPWQMLLLYQWAKSDTSALFQYLGNTAPGNHHTLMLAASTYMWHERFTQDEITEICRIEAAATAPDDETLRSREAEINTATRNLPNMAPVQKPSSKNTRGPKTPRDREMLEYLREKFPVEGLAYFSGLPFWWNVVNQTWEQMTNLEHPEPWARMHNHLLAVFDDANHGLVVQAIKSFIASIPVRQAAPDTHLIPFGNGMLDVTTGELRPEVREDYITARIEHDYDPEAEAPLWDRFIYNLMLPPEEFADRNDYVDDHKKAIDTLEEYLGYCLTRSHAMQKMLFIIGASGVGKSVLIKVLRGLLPKQWCSTVSMDAFEEANSLVQMAQAYINISAEVGRRNRNVDDILLRVTAGEEVEIKLLYANRMQAVLPTRLLFHGNLTPDTTDVTGAIERRMIILRTTDIKPSPVPLYEERLLREAQGILARLARAYARLVNRGYFDMPNYSILLASSITNDSNSCSAWLHECCVHVSDSLQTSVNSDLYDHYAEWCVRNGMYKYSVVQWGKLLTSLGHPSIRARIPGTDRFAVKRRLKLLANPSRVQY